MAFLVDNTNTYTPDFKDQRPGYFSLDILKGEELNSCPLKQQIEYFTIILITEGIGELEIDFKKYVVENPALLFLTPGQVFRSKSFHINAGFQLSFDKHFYCVETHGQAIACNGILFNNVNQSTLINLNSSTATFFKDQLSQIFNELLSSKTAQREMLEAQLRMLIIHALRKIDVVDQEEDVVQNRLVRDFIASVNKNFLTKHAVSDYASLLAVSPKSLTKRMKAEGYPTPTKVIRDRIMLEAQRRLRLENITVKSLAYDLGFEDPAYFTRLFSKETGQSPMAYQKAFLIG